MLGYPVAPHNSTQTTPMLSTNIRTPTPGVMRQASPLEWSPSEWHKTQVMFHTPRDDDIRLNRNVI